MTSSTSSAKQLGHVLSDGLQERGFEIDDSAEDGTGDYYLSLFSGDFVGSYRVTPDGKILAIGVPNNLANKAIRDVGLGSRLGKDIRRSIKVYFSIVSPESAEEGEEAETGEEDEHEIEPSYGETFADVAVKYLKHQGTSDSGGDWFESEVDMDYRTGAQTLYSFHLKGFTDAEEKEIWRRMGKRR
jgi:hypothetical protein